MLLAKKISKNHSVNNDFLKKQNAKFLEKKTLEHKLAHSVFFVLVAFCFICKLSIFFVLSQKTETSEK